MSKWVWIYEGVAVRGVALPVSQFRYLRGAESAHCQPPLRSKSLRPIHRVALYPVSKPTVQTHFINTFHWVLNKNESSNFCLVCSAFTRIHFNPFAKQIIFNKVMNIPPSLTVDKDLFLYFSDAEQVRSLLLAAGPCFTPGQRGLKVKLVTVIHQRVYVPKRLTVSTFGKRERCILVSWKMCSMMYSSLTFQLPDSERTFRI